MHKLCFPGKRSNIYLTEDDDEEENSSSFLSCCLNFRGNRQGLIQLPQNHGRTVDDYLDPRSPVSIEALLQEQEEELDQYYSQTDDEDAYHGPHKKFSPLNLNLEANQSAFFEEEDAQFLSEHRISAIFVDRPKLSSVFKDQLDDGSNPSQQDQELLDVATIIPTTSTSTGSTISSRRFAFKKIQQDDNTQSQSPQELSAISSNDRNIPFAPSSTLLSPSSSSTTIHTQYSASSPVIRAAIATTDQEITSKDLPLVTQAISTSVITPSHRNEEAHGNITDTSDRDSSHLKKREEFPVTSLTRVPYQPKAPIAQHSVFAIQENNNTEPRASMLQPSTSSPSPAPPGRRPSVVTAAQSILGDKLDDFTEKLAFIKKNIISSMDDDSDDEERYSNSMRRQSQDNYSRDQPSKIYRKDERPTWSAVKPYSSSSTSSLPLPPRTSSRANIEKRRLSNIVDPLEEEEDIFDFSKVVAISKNVRTFGEGVMGNGIRMFNSLSTRIKSAQQQQQQQQQQQNQRRQQLELNENNSNSN